MRTTRRVLLAATAAVLVAGCATGSNPPAAAAVAEPAVRPGKFVWHDLVTDSPDACRRFYAALLGWEFDDVQRLGRPYAIARLGPQRVAGIVASRQGRARKSQWVGYVSVPDVDRAVEAATRAGGRTLAAPREVESIARAAVVEDPQGAALGFARIHAGDPADAAAPQEGRFFWMEYFARDPDAALSYYTTLLGYQSEATERLAGLAYQVLRTDRPRAGLLPVPQPEMRPAWLPYVMVTDPAGLAERARALGGTVLFEPRADVRKGTLAIVADPSGAPLALQKWPIS
ncbi:MAG TPA: VOC family protein [Vicinamibacteria bacterium]|jgi:predicted enzyme related to lactoylglutathione lyase